MLNEPTFKQEKAVGTKVRLRMMSFLQGVSELKKGRNQLSQMSSLQSRLYQFIWDVLVWFW